MLIVFMVISNTVVQYYCVFIQCLIIHVAISLCLCHYRRGHLKVAEFLINNDADVQSKDDEEWTPLHYACL